MRGHTAINTQSEALGPRTAWGHLRVTVVPAENAPKSYSSYRKET